jgi:hypothetical protein
MSPLVRWSTAHQWWYHRTSTVAGQHHSQCGSCHKEDDLLVHPKNGDIRGVHFVKGIQNHLVSGPATGIIHGSHGKKREGNARGTETCSAPIILSSISSLDSSLEISQHPLRSWIYTCSHVLELIPQIKYGIL